MTEHSSDPQNERPILTLREMLEGYELFNAREQEERSSSLPFLSVDEALDQYFELYGMAIELAGDDLPLFLEQHADHWSLLHRRNKLLRSITPNEETAPSTG